MGNQDAKDDRSPGERANVLIIGRAGNGKSSLLNTIYRCVKKTNQHHPLDTYSAESTQRGSYFYAKLPDTDQLINMAFFDIPGMNFTRWLGEEDDPNDFLLKVMGGIKVGQQLIVKDAIVENPVIDVSNKIHFIIIVISLTFLEKEYKKKKEDPDYYDADLGKIKELSIKIQRLTGNPPLVILTHKDKMKTDGQIKDLKKYLLAYGVPIERAIPIQNYTDVKEKHKETESNIKDILYQISALVNGVREPAAPETSPATPYANSSATPHANSPATPHANSPATSPSTTPTENRPIRPKKPLPEAPARRSASLAPTRPATPATTAPATAAPATAAPTPASPSPIQEVTIIVTKGDLSIPLGPLPLDTCLSVLLTALNTTNVFGTVSSDNLMINMARVGPRDITTTTLKDLNITDGTVVTVVD